MKLAFISSPYAPISVTDALYVARELSKIAVQEGYIPISPVLNFHGVLQENTPSDRESILVMCQEMLNRCDVVYVADTEVGISEGMRHEINFAESLHKPIIKRKVVLYRVETHTTHISATED